MHRFAFFLALAFCVPLAARPGQSVLRSGDTQNADVESPLSEEAVKYRTLLDLSNGFMDAILAGRDGALYDTQFSNWLKESMDRSWFLGQLNSLRTLHGPPTSYKKLQWYFVEESIQGKPLVHSVKLMHFGNEVVQFVTTVPAGDLKRVLGFQIIPPPERQDSAEEKPAFSSAAGENEEAEQPLSQGADAYEILLKSANAFLDLLQSRNYKNAYDQFFAESLKAQASETGLEEAHKRTSQIAGPMESYKHTQWMFFLRKYQGGDVVILRKVVHHSGTIMYYNFAALVKDQKHFIGFQSLPKPGPAQTRYYYTDPQGKKIEAK